MRRTTTSNPSRLRRIERRDREKTPPINTTPAHAPAPLLSPAAIAASVKTAEYKGNRLPIRIRLNRDLHVTTAPIPMPTAAPTTSVESPSSLSSSPSSTPREKVRANRISTSMIVLFDIDDTLINYKRSEGDKLFSPTWHGGSVQVWKKYLQKLREAAGRKGISIYFGIATLKRKYKNDLARLYKLIGDSISAVILEDDALLKENNYRMTFQKDVPNLIPEGCGLVKFDNGEPILDPELIFFLGEYRKTAEREEDEDGEDMGDPVKTRYGLMHAQEIIGERERKLIPRSNIFIADDMHDICKNAELNGFGTLPAAELARAGNVAEERRIIANMFEPLFAKLDAMDLFIQARRESSLPNSPEATAPAKIAPVAAAANAASSLSPTVNDDKQLAKNAVNIMLTTMSATLTALANRSPALPATREHAVANTVNHLNCRPAG